jgi:RNA polymerase sigma factor (sigma-70 family)
VGRGMSGVAEPAATLGQCDGADPSDHQLVAALRRGDDRAFEQLYHRYQRRIHAYVLGMCKDHARAEDITQEVFVSAVRRMRETERPIAFKPWIYEIAKNACIDQHRRACRTEEVSLQAEDGLAPADYGRLVNSDPTPDVAVAAKQDLDHLCGAFGGLSETHHEILVMRELEGLSYREIGERLGMSRPAVESTLFRARRRLTEEYDELVSGARCLRIQGVIATAARGQVGSRDTARLARHVAHCQPCRRDALAAGLDPSLLRQPLRTRVAAKVAALLPFPLLGRRGGGRGTDDAASGMASASSGFVAHLPTISDQLGAGWAKAAAAAALLLAGVGAGVGTEVATDSGHPAAQASAAQGRGEGAPGGGGGAAAPAARVAARSETAAAGRAVRPVSGARGRDGGSAGTGTAQPGPGGAPASERPALPGAPAAASPITATVGGGVPATPKAGGPSLSTPASERTAVAPGTVASGVTAPVSDAVDGTVDGSVGTVSETVGTAGDALDRATGGATTPATGAVGDAVDRVGATVSDLTP